MSQLVAECQAKTQWDVSLTCVLACITAGRLPANHAPFHHRQSSALGGTVRQAPDHTHTCPHTPLKHPLKAHPLLHCFRYHTSAATYLHGAQARRQLHPPTHLVQPLALVVAVLGPPVELEARLQEVVGAGTRQGVKHRPAGGGTGLAAALAVAVEELACERMARAQQGAACEYEGCGSRQNCR